MVISKNLVTVAISQNVVGHNIFPAGNPHGSVGTFVIFFITVSKKKKTENPLLMADHYLV